MRKLVKTLVFKVGLEILASLDMDTQTILDVENFKCILATQYNVTPDDIEAIYEIKEVVDPKVDLFISTTGKLCLYNEMWDVEIVESLSFVDWVDLSTEEGINILSDYKILKKEDELVKFN